MLYAVGIGAGTDELAFTTENTANVEQLVFPTFPVVIGWGGDSPMRAIGTFNPALLVHGQQAVTLHRPIPVAGTVTLQSKITDMYDKVKAAVVVTETTAEMDGEPLYTNRGIGVHPWRRRLGWRPWPFRPAERAAGPRARSRGHLPDVARSGARLSADAAIATRSTPIRRSPRWAASTVRSCTGCAATGSPVGRCSTRCATATRRGSTTSRPASRRRCCPATRLTVRMWTTGDGESVFTTSVGDRLVIDQGL